jgi:serine protease
LTTILTPQTGIPYAVYDEDHGTAVLGELVGKDNDRGVKGIAFDSDIGLAPEFSIPWGSQRGRAIIHCVIDGKKGDVILLEMQREVCGGSYGPAEVDQSVYDASATAVANGFVVVAAAGNGDMNLDAAGCAGIFDTSVRDSGAIIVGAGYKQEKLYFSSYGSRVDVQGQGYGVYTTGYGDAFYDPNDYSNVNRHYTDDFSGTSSASPIVAGAAAVLQSYSQINYGRVLTPNEVRSVREPLICVIHPLTSFNQANFHTHTP